MNIPTKERVISNLEKQYNIRLNQILGKQILYEGALPNQRRFLICTPQSKLHEKGYGWVDLTMVQISLLEKADYAILVLRLEGNKTYHIEFPDLKPFLTEKAMVYNKREGEHWKLRIWPSYIEIIGNNKYLQITPTSFS